MGDKSKKKSTRSVNSNNSKNSSKTMQASNVSSASATASSSSISGISPKRNTKKQNQRLLLPPTATETKTPSQQPVDLDRLSDNLSRAHHANDHNFVDEGLSPAETFDTVPLSASPSRSFGSRSGISHHSNSISPNKNRGNGSDDGTDNYLPIALQFDSPNAKVSRSSNSKNNNNTTSKVVIEHKINKDSKNGNFTSRSAFCGGNAGLYLCLIKPVLLILLLMALVSGGASVYGWLFKFPALNEQVAALEHQVFQLKEENDRYAVLNDRLNLTVDDLEVVKNDLNMTVSDLDQVADALNTTRDQIFAEIQELKTQNLEYAQLNNRLQTQVGVLGKDLESFRSALEDLSQEHSVLQNTTEALQNLAMQFSNTTFDQNETLKVLQQTLEGFRDENDRLETFNAKLEAGLEYLNDTLLANGNLVESSAIALTEITRVLGEQVQQQQWTTLQQLEISYRQFLAGWDCDYRDVFRSKDFGQDFDTAILGTSTTEERALLLPPDVQNYLGDRVFSKVCLDQGDFSKFLFELTVGEGRVVTSNQLIRAIVLYTEDAMQYYFPLVEAPESGTDGAAALASAGSEDGITMSEWIDASFRCDLLESPFRSSEIGGIDVRHRKLPFSNNLRGIQRQ